MFENIITYYTDMLRHINESGIDFIGDVLDKSYSPVLNALRELNLRDINTAFEFQLKNKETFTEKVSEWWEKHTNLMQHLDATDSDQRFIAQEWHNADIYTCIKDYYLYFCKQVENSLSLLHCQDEGINSRLRFFSRQYLNALSPANFFISNPEVVSLTNQTRGQNLMKGVENLLKDIHHSGDVLNIRQVRQKAFILGKDLANTPGAVVFRNDLCELIQYTPLTLTVNQTPLLIIPPLINKYYILDLSEKNSMVRWLLEQGHCVFILSWRNPDESLQDISFSDYVQEGVVRAISVIEDITNREQVNAAGYCLGGTLLAAAVAYYAARRMKKHIKSATYFTTLVDFSIPGELGAYLDPELIKVIDAQNRQQGYMDGRLLNVTFNLLRENTLYWNFYIDRYLKGKSSADFDLLFWSSDSTNVTATCWYDIVRKFYIENQLIQSRKYKVGGCYIDLSKIHIPSYFVATQDDHIALWQGVYRGAQHMKEDAMFVLGGAGHIAGIINPPTRNKYSYRVSKSLPESPEKWLSEAQEYTGSWWPHWNDWLNKNETHPQVEACDAGNVNFPVLDCAPGRYVMHRLA